MCNSIQSIFYLDEYPCMPKMLCLLTNLLPWIWMANNTDMQLENSKQEYWANSTSVFINSRVSSQKGPTRHTYAWQIGPFWQDILELSCYMKQYAENLNVKPNIVLDKITFQLFAYCVCFSTNNKMINENNQHRTTFYCEEFIFQNAVFTETFISKWFIATAVFFYAAARDVTRWTKHDPCLD